MRGLTRVVGTYVWNAGAQAGLAVRGTGFLATRAALEKENASLREQLARADTRTALYQALEEENQALRGIVHLTEREQGITARVVSSLRASPYGTFTVGAGKADGIAIGSLVMTSDAGAGGFVIGRVSDVGTHTALVTEFFAPNVSTEATIRGASIVLQGRGGGNARATVPRSVAVVAGDPVTSPLFGGRALGVVGAVHAESASAYSEVYVGFPVNLAATSFVYVISVRN